MMHQRISKKIIIYLFIFFSLVTITNTKLSDDYYKIKEFNINGLNTSETKKIYDDLSIFKNTNIFLFDKKNISKKIYSNKVVEKLKVFKNYPSTLNIEIKKTKFLAFTKKNNRNYKYNDVKDLYYFKSNRWDVITKNGITLKMPSNPTIEKLNLIFKIIQENNFKNDKIIDYRQNNMIVTNG